MKKRARFCAVGIALLMVTLSHTNGEEMWKLPSALNIKASLEACHILNFTFLNTQNYNETKDDDVVDNIRCFASALKLWTDEEGFYPKGFVKLLEKHNHPTEILVLVGYCNKYHKQSNLNKWARKAYNCFAKGRIGIWISEYIRNFYMEKNSRNDQ